MWTLACRAAAGLLPRTASPGPARACFWTPRHRKPAGPCDRRGLQVGTAAACERPHAVSIRTACTLGTGARRRGGVCSGDARYACACAWGRTHARGRARFSATPDGSRTTFLPLCDGSRCFGSRWVMERGKFCRPARARETGRGGAGGHQAFRPVCGCCEAGRFLRKNLGLIRTHEVQSCLMRASFRPGF
jgi:hypothetical protein